MIRALLSPLLLFTLVAVAVTARLIPPLHPPLHISSRRIITTTNNRNGLHHHHHHHRHLSHQTITSRLSSPLPLLSKIHGGAIPGQEPVRRVAVRLDAGNGRLSLVLAVLQKVWPTLVLGGTNIMVYLFSPGRWELLKKGWEMDGYKVLASGQWHRLWTSLFVHRGPQDLGWSCLGLAIYGTISAHVFGPGKTFAMYLANGLMGNVAQLAVYALGRVLAGRYVAMPTLRDTVGRYLGDLGIPTNQTVATSIGSVMGLASALWTVFLRHVEKKDLRLVPPLIRQLYRISYAMSGVFGIMATMAVGIELLFPRFGKAAPVGAIVTGIILGSVLPYKVPYALQGLTMMRGEEKPA